MDNKASQPIMRQLARRLQGASHLYIHLPGDPGIRALDDYDVRTGSHAADDDESHIAEAPGVGAHCGRLHRTRRYDDPAMSDYQAGQVRRSVGGRGGNLEILRLHSGSVGGLLHACPGGSGRLSRQALRVSQETAGKGQVPAAIDDRLLARRQVEGQCNRGRHNHDGCGGPPPGTSGPSCARRRSHLKYPAQPAGLPSLTRCGSKCFFLLTPCRHATPPVRATY
jgi:hypothetical protein